MIPYKWTEWMPDWLYDLCSWLGLNEELDLISFDLWADPYDEVFYWGA